MEQLDQIPQFVLQRDRQHMRRFDRPGAHFAKSDGANELPSTPAEGLMPVVSERVQWIPPVELVVHTGAELSFVLFETAACVAVQNVLGAPSGLVLLAIYVLHAVTVLVRPESASRRAVGRRRQLPVRSHPVLRCCLQSSPTGLLSVMNHFCGDFQGHKLSLKIAVSQSSKLLF